eukprot:6209608-Pleurochrysis_carterae.AAC.3
MTASKTSTRSGGAGDPCLRCRDLIAKHALVLSEIFQRCTRLHARQTQVIFLLRKLSRSSGRISRRTRAEASCGYGAKVRRTGNGSSAAFANAVDSRMQSRTASVLSRAAPVLIRVLKNKPVSGAGEHRPPRACVSCFSSSSMASSRGYSSITFACAPATPRAHRLQQPERR